MDTCNNSPHWASSMIWYQIFPDRFHKSSFSTTSPTISDLSGAWPNDLTSPWEVSSWSCSWHAFHPHEISSQSIFHHIQRRRYGGNLSGIIEKLEYLKSFGIEGIYITPLFYAPSAHKYDAKMLHHIDPFFGPDPEKDKAIMKDEIFHDEETWKWTSADLLALDLLEKAEKLGLKVIFDGVFNHIGMTSSCFQDVEQNQESSIYKDWFQIESFRSEKTTFKYKGWFGVNELPQFLQTEDDLAEGPKSYIYKITKRWMKPIVNGIERKGVDGWRLDVAYCINHGFWKKWRSFVLSLNKEAFLTGEIIDNFDNVAKYLKGDELDSVMNYNFWQGVIEFFGFNRLKPTEFSKFWSDMLEKIPEQAWFLLQNLLNSHDTARILTVINNRNVIKSSAFDFGKFFNETLNSSNGSLMLMKPESDEYKIFKMMVVFQMTFIGSPLIFYGDEVGMWGANDPDCRKPMLWEDIIYDDEVIDNKEPGSVKIKSKVGVNKDIFDFYKKIIEIRKKEKTLREGKLRGWINNDEKNIYGFFRETAEERIGIVFNNGFEEEEIEWAGEINLLLGEDIKIRREKDNFLSHLKGKSFIIMKFHK